MYLIYCSYPTRDIKKIINQLISKGIDKIVKINYAKSYGMSGEKRTQMTKISVLHVYVGQENKLFFEKFLKEKMPDCDVYFFDNMVCPNS